MRRLLSRPRFKWEALVRDLHRRYPRRAHLPLAVVNVASQRLHLVEHRRLVADYPVSTSRFGVGSREHSFRTPLGAHRVRGKTGAGCEPLTLFKGRKETGARATLNPLATVSGGDAVCTRVLWLDGLEPRRNRGGCFDSARRCIYIHGTVDERRLGRPSSIGCVRMGNADVVEVFDALDEDSLVCLVHERPRAAECARDVQEV